MKQALINALKMETISKLSIEDKAKVVKKLRDRYKLSYRDLEKVTGISHSTLQDWVSGRQKNVPGSLHVSLTSLINHFKVYEPKNIHEWCKIEQLKKIIEELINKKSPKNKLKLEE